MPEKRIDEKIFAKLAETLKLACDHYGKDIGGELILKAYDPETSKNHIEVAGEDLGSYHFVYKVEMLDWYEI